MYSLSLAGATDYKGYFLGIDKRTGLVRFATKSSRRLNAAWSIEGQSHHFGVRKACVCFMKPPWCEKKHSGYLDVDPETGIIRINKSSGNKWYWQSWLSR